MEAALQLIHEYFIPFLVVLGAVVFVHEYGHYWAAKQCGVKVESFSIGFGPELVGWNDKHGTRWKICLLPLGGYVKMYGDADPASSPDEKALHQMTPTDRERAFFYKSVNKRALIVFAGPAANFLFSLLVLCVLFTVEGQPYTPPVVAKLVPGEASEQAGLQLEDKILSINGVGVERFEDIQRLIRLNRGEPVLLNVQRAGTTFSINMTPKVGEMKDRFGNTHLVGRIGIGSGKMDIKKMEPHQALGRAVHEIWYLCTGTLTALGQMIAGTRSAEELGGALRIAQMSGDMAKKADIPTFVWFIAVISVNLGFINLFPIPLLDGGHLVFYGIEKVRGKPLPLKIQEVAMRAGMLMVLGLMLFATWNDLVHLKVIDFITSMFS